MRTIFTVICIICIAYIRSKAESFKWDPSIDSITTLIMHQDYDRADQYCNDRLSKSPLDIDARYMKLVTLQSQIADYESYAIDGQRCISIAESTLVYIAKSISGNPSRYEKLKLTYYKGSVLGILGVLKSKRGNVLSGIKDARSSYDVLKVLNDSAPDFTEALYGIGLYDYYVGDNLKWLPGLSKKSRIGLHYLYKVSDCASPFRYGAKNSLLWILLDRKEYAIADSICSEVLKSFPANTVFLQIKSRAVFGCKDYNQAIALGQRLIDISLKRKRINWTDVLSGYQLISACWLKEGNRKKAQETAEMGLSLKLPAEALQIEWVQKHRNYLLSIK